MAGIYIHIPFCKQRCFYCDFFSDTQMVEKKNYIDALIKEISLRKNYLSPSDKIKTIYIGGGTPSLLEKVDFEEIILTLGLYYDLSEVEEFTVEANPDDITAGLLEALIKIGCNRLSIGIQSFNNEELKILGRRHDALQAKTSVNLAKQFGFNNISIDLMYGLPAQTETSWQNTIKEALSLDVQHISAYHLTYEKGTPFFNMLQNKQIKELDEEISLKLYNSLVNMLNNAMFNQYEISNFSLSGFESKHNSSYWENIAYIGLGAAAHSYNQVSRQWNIASIKNYCKKINEGEGYFETEILSTLDKYNDYLITSLRTNKGIDKEIIKSSFGKVQLQQFIKKCETHIKNNKLCEKDNFVRLTQSGIFVSDSILQDLIEIQ